GDLQVHVELQPAAQSSGLARGRRSPDELEALDQRLRDAAPGGLASLLQQVDRQVRGDTSRGGVGHVLFIRLYERRVKGHVESPRGARRPRAAADYALYSTGFFASSITSPTFVVGVQVAQSFC